MRRCGECTLCCKIPRIAVLDKASNEWCRYCDRGRGCAIYDLRPKVCEDFKCLWLKSDMPDEMRPDRIHMYVSGDVEDDVLKVRVDPAFPNVWNGSEVVEYLLKRGKHVLVSIGHQITFLCGEGKAVPEKIMLEWTL